jgi:flagellar hook-length control protein FliK
MSIAIAPTAASLAGTGVFAERVLRQASPAKATLTQANPTQANPTQTNVTQANSQTRATPAPTPPSSAQAHSARAGLAQANSAQASAAASDEDAAAPAFGDALRAQVAADQAAPASIDATSAPVSTPPSLAANLQGHSDALWQRLFAGPSPVATAKPLKTSSDVDDDAAVLPSVPAAVTFLPVVPAAIASMPPMVAAAASADSHVDSTRSAVRGTAAFRDANNLVPATTSAAEEPASGVITAAAPTGPSTPSRGAGLPAVLNSADPASIPQGSQAQTAPLVGLPAVDPSSAYRGADPTRASADVSHAVQTGTSLVQALGEHLQVQIARGSENAVIRLDPPSLGSIEITIRHEAGAIQVHLSAGNGDVLSQLQGIGAALRQDLIQRHQGEISVQVSDGSGNAQERQRQANAGQEEPGQALQDAAGEESATFTLARHG